MNDQELKKLWQISNEKWDESMLFNKRLLREVYSDKAKSKINSFTNNHIFVMLLGVIWIALLIYLIYYNLNNIYFTVSAGIIMVFNIFAVILYLKHIIILKSIDMTESITETQRKIVRVYTSYTQSSRILLLQAPFFCTFWYTDELVQTAGPLFWSIQLIIVNFFLVLSIYLYRKLSIHNPSDTWRRISNQVFGAHKLQKAMDFLKEIDE